MEIPENIIRRIEPFIHQETDDCIEYPTTNKDDYPDFHTKVGGKVKHFRMHRVAYQVYYGEELTSEDVICHKCDNPKCVNPRHLFKGTHNDNVQDKVSKGRQAKGASNGRYVDGYYTKEAIEYRKNNPRPRTWQRRLPDDTVRRIRELRRQGYKLQNISNETGVNISTVKDICSGRAYSDLL